MTISRLSSGLPTFTDVTNPEVKRFLKVLGKHYGKTIKVARLRRIRCQALLLLWHAGADD